MSRIQQASILVIDTDVESLFSVASLLTQQNHRVVTARDLRTATCLAVNEHLDLVITSYRIERISGVEFVSNLKQNRRKRKLKTMFVSSQQTSDVILKQHSFGAAYHIKKPVHLKVLVNLVAHTIGTTISVQNHIDSTKPSKPHIQFGKKPIFPVVGQPHAFGTGTLCLDEQHCQKEQAF